MGSTFGESIGPIVYSQVRCGGWETSLDECMKTKYIDFTCPRDRIAGALCVDGELLLSNLRPTIALLKTIKLFQVSVDYFLTVFLTPHVNSYHL